MDLTDGKECRCIHSEQEITSFCMLLMGPVELVFEWGIGYSVAGQVTEQ